MTTIDPTARIEDGAAIGEGTTIGPYCVIGRDAVIGANCKLIAHVHVTGHTTIGAGCTIYPFASLGGAPQSLGYRGEPTKLEIGDFVFIGGLSAVHQFTRVGPQVMIGGVCGVRGDIIPYGLVNGQYARLEGLNIVGMRRRKFTRERLASVRSFYQELFEAPGIFSERLAAVRSLTATDPAIAEILTFIDAGKHRPLCLPSSGSGSQE